MSEEITTVKSKTKETATSVERKPRKKVYERVRESQIPEDLISYFAQDDYDLKLVRWAIDGQEDYRYLNRREKEGYEFVTKDEVPESYLRAVNIIDTKTRKGLIIVGDLCLMKIDKDLRNSRRRVFEREADSQHDAVDIHTLRKKGFIDGGSSSKVVLKEPTFQD